VCSDPSNGNVFVTADNRIDEYTHGGTSPIATLTPPSGDASLWGCSIDVTTGNLAVAVSQTNEGPSDNGAVLIFKGAKGSPAIYSDKTMHVYYYCGYDGAGNLYVVGDGYDKNQQLQPTFTQLPKGSSTFTDFTLNSNIGYVYKVQWDGKYLAMHADEAIYRVQVSGGTGTIVGVTPLTKSSDDNPASWIQGNTVIAPYVKRIGQMPARLGFWKYPAGGKVASTLGGLRMQKHDILNDVTVSVAPSR